MTLDDLKLPDMRRHKPTENNRADKKHRVVIVGGGFGGIYCARNLQDRDDLEIILIDKKNYHLFIPLLYQVATGFLSPGNISAPYRTIFRRKPNVRVVLGEVTEIDVKEKRVQLKRGNVEYDTLVLAAGAPAHHYFGNREWAPHAQGLKSVEDAIDIRGKVLMAFEAADREPDPARRRKLQTFVIVGAGPTGVELAGAVAELAKRTLPGEYSIIRPEDSKVILLEGMDQVLPSWDEKLAKKSKQMLRELGVTVRTGAMVSDIENERVIFEFQDRKRQVEAGTILWAGGVQANPLGEQLCRKVGCETDKLGRVLVNDDLSVNGHPEIYVVGDMAHIEDENGDPRPGLAQVAMQGGEHVANQILNRADGKSTDDFHYRDKGIMATIGRGRAVADLGKLKLTGAPGWLLWLFVHLMYLVLFQDRLLVLLQWGWNYVTHNRSARLITNRSIDELQDETGQTPVALDKS